MSNIASKTALIVAAALTLSIAASQAQAAPALPTVQVSYADLNLDSQHGRVVLVARIQNAARTVCAPQADLHGVQASLNYAKCLRESTQRAAASVTAPQLRTALESMLTNGSGT
jgi:UrcA family protein